MIHALGVCRFATATPALTDCARSDDALVRDATLTALGRIATPEAADALLALAPTGGGADRLIDARLLCAQKLIAASQDVKAKTLYLSVRTDAAATPAQRAAALIGLTALAPDVFADVALAALADKDVHLRRGAAAALRHADRVTLEKARSLFASLPRDGKLALLTLWDERGVKAAESEMLGCLAASDDELKKAAVRALRRIGSPAAVRPLFALALAGDETGREAETTLTQLADKGIIGELQAEVKSADAKCATLAINLVAERKDPGHIAFLLGVAKDGDEQRTETVLNALKRFADADTLAALRHALAELPDLEKPIAQTILSICKRQVVSSAQQKTELQAAVKNLHDDTLRAQFKELLATLNQRNLALGKKVTSSHVWQDNLAPALAVDGDPDTYWSCAFSPSWIQVDMETPVHLSRIKVVNYVDGTRYYQYRVEISADGKGWMCVGDMSANRAPATKEGATFAFLPMSARYVRVTMLQNSANPGMHISELGIYGGDE
jgi:HEAT repeat protein